MSDFPQPLNLATLLYLAVATSLGWIGGWLARRKREPHELRKLDAETRQIQTSSEISPVGITLETLREIQAVIQKAEQRRDEWHEREEQMRTQILFWRNKAEEIDGELADSRQANGLMDTRLKLHEHQVKKLKALLDFHNINYSELDQPKR